MTFDDLKPDTETPSVLREDGITATMDTEDWFLTGAYGNPGTLHLDDGGPFVGSVVFTMDDRFHAGSFDILPSGSAFGACEDMFGGDCVPLGFDNVRVSGYRDGLEVAVDYFDMFAVGGTYSFDETFTDLDALLIGFAPIPFGEMPDGLYATCRDSPCTHFDIDNVALAPVPLPAALGLMMAALGGLGVARRARRT